MATIGIPKGMFYFEYSVMWEEFFRILGFDVVISQDTNRKVMDDGVKYCSNETCLPVKVFHGHVANLKNRVDYVFIPRYQSTDKNEYTCPKFCALPDMIATNLGRGTKILEVKINIDSKPGETTESLKVLAKTLHIKPSKIIEAFNEAQSKYMQYRTRTGTKTVNQKNKKNDRVALSLLGHPYMIYDSCLNMRLVEKLNRRNIDVLTPRDIDYETKRRNAYPYQGRIFWDVGFELLGSAFTYALDDRIKGIIYLTPFACGLDAFIMEFIESRVKSLNNNLPLLKLTVDEHTGEAGFDTRLEAFIDMIG
jgi:predicted nucleotide-binding protein (sugar kinase/HSP70/actin superfamily)